MPFVVPVVGQPGPVGSVGVHNVYLEASGYIVVPNGGKGNLGAVRRPGRMFIFGVDGQPGPVGPVGVHGVYLIWCHQVVYDKARRVGKGDLGAVRRPGRATIYCRAAG